MSASGGCLCGAVRYQVRGALRPVIFCHCRSCRRSSGHFVAATACARNELVVTVGDALRWYDSSSWARRGFCSRCGSNLFWEPKGKDYVSIMAGSLDSDAGLTAREHIFVGEAGGYYRIGDGLPQSEAWEVVPAP
jgi:hypothetical protein